MTPATVSDETICFTDLLAPDQPPFPRPPAFAKATADRPVRPKRCCNGCPPKANS